MIEPSSALRVGVAGFAHPRAPAYARALRLAGVALVGIWDDDQPRGAAARAHDVRIYAQLDELLAEVDTLIVTTTTVRHTDVVLAAAAAGVHTLCEPPLATTIEDGQALVGACAAAGVRLGTAFPARYSDAARGLRAAVADGTLGETLMIRATSRGAFPGGWLGDPALAGGGAIMDRAGHAVDLLRWIWRRELAEVYAETATRHHELPVEDSALLLITLDGGLAASLDASWSLPAGAGADLTIEVTGTAGAAALDIFAQHVELHRGASGAERLSWGDDLDRLMLEDWLRAIRAGAPAPISGADGLRALDLALAAYRSAQSHAPVQIHAVVGTCSMA